MHSKHTHEEKHAAEDFGEGFLSFFFFWNTPPGAHLLGSVCLFTSILVSAGVWHHGEKKLKYSSKRIFYSGHKIYTC